MLYAYICVVHRGKINKMFRHTSFWVLPYDCGDKLRKRGQQWGVDIWRTARYRSAYMCLRLGQILTEWNSWRTHGRVITMLLKSDVVKTLSWCFKQTAASSSTPFAKTTEHRGGRGGERMRGCMVDRLGAWIWDKAWKQRKLENSSGWNEGCAPCPPSFPPILPHPFSLQQCSRQMEVRVGGLMGWRD